jgi:hypothetical protein
MVASMDILKSTIFLISNKLQNAPCLKSSSSGKAYYLFLRLS